MFHFRMSGGKVDVGSWFTQAAARSAALMVVGVVVSIFQAATQINEATLSFLGVGVPPTSPTLGLLIRVGNDFLFSGEWWIVLFPAVVLAALVLAVNLLGDWLRDVLNPRLR